MKYILLISNLKNGGSQKLVSLLSNSLEGIGHETLVVTFDKEDFDFPVPKIIQMDLVAKGNIFKRLILFIRRYFLLRNIKEEYKPDVSIGFLFSSNLLNSITRKKCETVISTIHDSIKFNDNNIYTFILNKFTYKMSDYVVTVSNGIKYQIANRYSGIEHKLKVIYSYVNLRNVTNARDQIKSPRLITIGRLETQKSQWHLIFAVKSLSIKYPDISLVILGRGSLETEFLNLINDLDLNKNVALKGFHSDIEPFLHVSDIFCLSSTHEGFGLVIIEAMNAALPIISTDIPHGPREILNPGGINLYSSDHILIDEKFGLLVEYTQNDNHLGNEYYDELIINQFVKKISLLIESPSTYNFYSKQSLIRVKDFSEQKIIEEWTKLNKLGTGR
jgi:glycosyltransferase involved in cell wall biosynthesis